MILLLKDYAKYKTLETSKYYLKPYFQGKTVTGQCPLCQNEAIINLATPPFLATSFLVYLLPFNKGAVAHGDYLFF